MPNQDSSYYTRNSLHMQQTSKRHYEANREAVAVVRARYYEANKETFRMRYWRNSARQRGATVLEAIHPRTIYDRDKGHCYICGRCVAFAAFELDHIIPVTRGGEHTYTNTAIVHRKCNNKKKCRRVEAPASTKDAGGQLRLDLQ